MHLPDPEPERFDATEADLLREKFISQEIEDMDRPHVVIVSDGPEGDQFVLGPFRDAFEALCAAEHERMNDACELDFTTGRSYRVHLLLDPIGDPLL
jgi:hypothetical protein